MYAFISDLPLLSVALWYMPPNDVVLRLMDPNGTEITSHVIQETDESEFRDNVRESYVSRPFSLFFFLHIHVHVSAQADNVAYLILK